MTATNAAGRAAVDAFVRTYSNPPNDMQIGQWQTRRQAYDLRWSFYNNSAFEDLAKWRLYRSNHRLYRHIRSVYNPTRRLVDFYAGIVYPGALTVDAQKLASGVPIAIPLSEDASLQLKAAIGQLWQWANWQAKKGLFVRYGAALGDTFVHVVDDVEAGIVYPEVVWPGFVSDLDLDSRGNVCMYQIEYTVYDDDAQQSYQYRRRVDKEVIQTFKDADLFSYDDVPAETPNPYGFVPACWCKHLDQGTDYGDPAIRNMSKVDELNSLVSMVLDNDRKILTAPVLVKGKGFTRMVTNRTQNMPTDMLRNPELDQEGINFVQGPSDADFKTLDLPEGEAMKRIDSLLAEIQSDHPELSMYTQLRAMTSVTGPGAARLFGDVETYVNDARANYDTQTIKLFQMCVAIGGYRANSGAWGNRLTRQQTPFLPFSLDSYALGDLDFSILPRPLIVPTEIENLQAEQMRLALEDQRKMASGETMTAAVNAPPVDNTPVDMATTNA